METNNTNDSGKPKLQEAGAFWKRTSSSALLAMLFNPCACNWARTSAIAAAWAALSAPRAPGEARIVIDDLPGGAALLSVVNDNKPFLLDSTLAELAGWIRTHGESQGWSSLVPIQPHGTRPPLFCVHAAGGNVLFYRDLAKRLGQEQPVYGLQTPGLDDGEAFFAGGGIDGMEHAVVGAEVDGVGGGIEHRRGVDHIAQRRFARVGVAVAQRTAVGDFLALIAAQIVDDIIAAERGFLGRGQVGGVELDGVGALEEVDLACAGQGHMLGGFPGGDGFAVAVHGDVAVGVELVGGDIAGPGA